MNIFNNAPEHGLFWIKCIKFSRLLNIVLHYVINEKKSNYILSACFFGEFVLSSACQGHRASFMKVINYKCASWAWQLHCLDLCNILMQDLLTIIIHCVICTSWEVFISNQVRWCESRADLLDWDSR